MCIAAKFAALMAIIIIIIILTIASTNLGHTCALLFSDAFSLPPFLVLGSIATCLPNSIPPSAAAAAIATNPTANRQIATACVCVCVCAVTLFDDPKLTHSLFSNIVSVFNFLIVCVYLFC